MRKTILRLLYSGELRLGENPQTDDAEYRKIMNDLDNEIANLSEDEQRSIEKLFELNTQMVSEEAEEAFCRGFALGIRMADEVDSVDFEDQ